MISLNKTIPFRKYVANHLRRLNIQLILISVILVFSASFLQVFLTQLEGDYQSIAPISTYLETLIDTNDRAELQKIIKSVGSVKKAKIQLVRNDKIFSTSGDNEELDQYFIRPHGIVAYNIIMNMKEYSIKTDIQNKGVVYLSSPWLPVLNKALSTFSFLLVSILVLLFIYFRKLKKVLNKSISPLNDLQADINNLLTGNKIKTNPLEITELEEIRLALVNTNTELENAKDFLAHEKAKKLNADAFKSLIHDLHSPVESLRLSIEIINDSTSDSNTRAEATKLIPTIADQLLLQVRSAQKNLEFESVNLQTLDVKECVRQCLSLIKANNKKEKVIITNIDDEKLIIPHDPILLQRALINLMENGLEFSKEKIEISTRRHKDYVAIKISDDGMGMSQNDIPIYFQGRGKSSKADRQAYGLSSTNHIARIHGGKLIYIKNELGGASFELRLGV